MPYIWKTLDTLWKPWLIQSNLSLLTTLHKAKRQMSNNLPCKSKSGSALTHMIATPVLCEPENSPSCSIIWYVSCEPSRNFFHVIKKLEKNMVVYTEIYMQDHVNCKIMALCPSTAGMHVRNHNACKYCCNSSK